MSTLPTYHGLVADTDETLCALYHHWMGEQGLVLGSADEELIYNESLTPHQRAWLAQFCARWEAWEERERLIRNGDAR